MRTRWITKALAGLLAGGLAGVGLTVVPALESGADPVRAQVSAQRLSDGIVRAGWTRTVADRPDLVGVRWEGDASARFAIQTRDAGDGWRTVVEVGAEPDHAPDPGTPEGDRVAAVAVAETATEPVWVGNADAVRVKLVQATARDVVVEKVVSPRASAPANTAGAMLVGMPGIISRVEWRADENLRLANCPEPPDISTNAKIAVVHHTAGSNAYGPGDTAAIVRGLYGYATQTLKYCDTHYNFFVDRYGQILEGRYGSVWDPVRAAHATGMNTGSVGVAVIGNFTSSGMPAATRDALERLLAWKLNWHGVDPTRAVEYTTISGTDRWPAGSTHALPFIVGHRDPGLTSCPGDGIYGALAQVRLSVAARILGGGSDAVGNHTVQSTRPKVAVVSRYGVVYPAGGAPELRASAVWPGWQIAKDLELLPGGLGGYTLDGFGGLHPFGFATRPAGAPYFPNFDIARDVALRDEGGGYVLDGWGGIHPFGGAPRLNGGPYFPGNDVAKKLVRFRQGWYVLDAYGALHPVGGSARLATPYWPGWPVARDVRPNPDGNGGYLLDAYGGIFRIGGAPALQNVRYFGRPVAVGLTVLSDGRGYTAREDGYLAPFGTAPALSQGRSTWRNAPQITTPWIITAVSGVR